MKKIIFTASFMFFSFPAFGADSDQSVMKEYTYGMRMTQEQYSPFEQWVELKYVLVLKPITLPEDLAQATAKNANDDAAFLTDAFKKIFCAQIASPPQDFVSEWETEISKSKPSIKNLQFLKTTKFQDASQKIVTRFLELINWDK